MILSCINVPPPSDTYTADNVAFHWHGDPDSKKTPTRAAADQSTDDDNSTNVELHVQPITYDGDIRLNTELPQFSIVKNETCKCNGTMDMESRE